MPKNSMKAAGNVYCEARLDASSCTDRFSSRERAAEVCGIDRTQLAQMLLELCSTWGWRMQWLSARGSCHFGRKRTLGRYRTFRAAHIAVLAVEIHRLVKGYFS